MSENKNGITLITLIFIIIILVILTSIFIASSLRALDETRKSEIQNEIKAIEDAIAIRYASYVKNDGNISLVGKAPEWASYSECADAIIETIDFSKQKEDEAELKKNAIRTQIQRDYDKYVKMISSGDAMILGIDTFSSDDVFVVDYYTSKAYGPIK